MPDTVAFFGLKSITGPIPPTRPNIFDKDAAIVLDPARIAGVADGARVSEVICRGNAPRATREFNQPVGAGLMPLYRASQGPDGGPVLDFTGSEALTSEGMINITGEMTILLTVQIREYAPPTTSNRRIMGSGDSGASPSIRPENDGSVDQVGFYCYGTQAFRATVTSPTDWKVIGLSLSPAGPTHFWRTGDGVFTRSSAWGGAATLARPTFATNTAGAGLADGSAGSFLLREARIFSRAMPVGEFEAECQRLEALFGIT